MANKDWIATLMFNNPSSLEEIAANGITPDNVDLQSPEYYKEKKEVQEKFSKNGEFDEVQFNNFYNSAVNMYNTFAEEDWTEKLVETLDKDPFDWTQPTKTNIKDVSATIHVKGTNPERRSMGIAGIDKIGDPVFSIREIAQDNYVRDENGNKLDWTPNQHGIFKSLLDPVVALAAYDEDGYHMQDGVKVFHRKGDYKIDEETGDFYYEVLRGDQESYGRDILRWTDTFTVDGSTMNKFDFFDSDGLDKSIMGTIAKTTFQIAPYLFPGVNKVAGAIEAVTALGRALPGLVKSVNGMFSTNENGIGKLATKAENLFEKFSTTQSDKAREGGFWSAESIADILSSSVKQLYSQKVLGNFVHKMASKADYSNPTQLGQKLSLAYMAITSSEDSYASAREAGASEGAAGIISLATGAALYKLMSADYFKNRLFKGSMLDESETVDVIKNFRDSDIKGLLDVYNATNATVETKSKNLFNSAYSKVLQWGEKLLNKPISGKAERLAASNIRPAWSAFSTVLNRATNEGIEETMEEVSSDIVKGIMVGLNELGFKSIKDKDAEELDFGFTPSGILTRYGQSFIGGFLGGAVFEGMNKWEGVFGPKVVSLASKDSKEQMIYLISTGRTQELLDRLDAMKDKGLLGNKNLSATKTRTNSEGKTVFEKGTDTDNQNLYNYNVIKNYIQYMNNVIFKLRLPIIQESSKAIPFLTGDTYTKFREEQDTAMKDQDLKSDQDAEYLFNNKTDAFLETIKHFQLHTSYISDIIDLNRKIVDTTAAIDSATQKITPSTQEERKEQADTTKQEDHIKQLRERLDSLVKERDNIVNHRNDDIYANQALFIVCKDVNEPFLKLVRGKSGDPTQEVLDSYSFSLYGKSYNSLEEAEKSEVNDRFNIKALNDIELRKKASDIYYRFLQALAPKVKTVNEKLKNLTPNNYYDHSLTVYQSKQFEEYNKNQLDKLTLVRSLDEVMKESSSTINSIIDNAVEKYDSLKEMKSKGINFYDLEAASEYFNSPDIDPKLWTEWNKAEAEITSELESNEELKRLKEASDDITSKISELDSKIEYYQKNQRVDKNIASNTLSEAGFSDITNPIIELLNQKDSIEEDIETLRSLYTNWDEISENPDILPSIQGVDWSAIKSADDINDKVIPEFKKRRTEVLNNILEKVKDYYQKLKDNKMVLSNDDLVSQAISYIVDPILSEEGFTQAFEYAFGDISEMHQDFSEEKVNNIKLKAYTYIKNLSIGNIVDSGYDDLVQSIGDEVEADDIKDFILKLTDGVDLNKFVNDIIALKDGITPLDTIDLIRNLKFSIDDTSIEVMELLKSEENTLRNGASIDEYVINDPLTKEALTRIPHIVELMDASLSAFTNGYTSTLNIFRGIASKEKMIDSLADSTVKIFSSDLEYLSNKATTLSALSDSYKARKSKFHTQSEMVVKSEFINSLFRPRGSEKSISDILKEGVTLNETTGEKVSIDLAKLWEKAGGKSFGDINDTNFAEFNKALFKFADLVYEEVQSKKLKGSDLGKLFESLLDGSEYKRNYGYFSDKRDYKATNLGVINFLSVISTIKLSDTYKQLRELYKGQKEVAPIFSQVWTILSEQSFLEDPALYNHISEKIKAKIKETGVSGNENVAKYLNNLSVLSNIFFCQGGPGTGKTKVIDKLSVELYKKRHPQAEIVLCAPHQTQLDALSNTVNDKKAKPVLLEDLISKICPSKPTYRPEEECRHAGQYEKSSIKIDKDSIKDLFTKKDRVLILDEVTFASEGDLQILSTWAVSNGIKIITSGDKKQNGKRVKNGEAWAISGIEDCIVASSLELTSTIRAENNAQQANILGIGNLCNIGYNALLDNPALSASDISSKYKNPVLSIDHYEELGKTFVGGKIVSRDDITKHYIDEFATLSGDKGKVLIITDTPEKYKNTLSKYKNIEIMNSNSSQGGEFEYVIIDKNFGTDEASLYDKIKDLNTLISRAKIGFVIAKTDSLNGFTIRNNAKSKEVANIPTGITSSYGTLKKFEEESHSFLNEGTSEKPTTPPPTTPSPAPAKPSTPETPDSGTPPPPTDPSSPPTTPDTTPADSTPREDSGSDDTDSETGTEDLSDKDKAFVSLLAPSVAIDPNEDNLSEYDVKEQAVDEEEALKRELEAEKKARRVASSRKKIQSTDTSLAADRLVFINELENSKSEFWQSLPSLISKFPDSLMGIDLSDEDQVRDYKSFVRLFSSGAIINMGFKSHHRRKFEVNASRVSFSKVDSLCDYWNSQVNKKFVVMPYGSKLDRSVIFYAGKYIDDSMQERNVLIPIATIQGNYKRIITLPKGKTLFKMTEEIQVSESEGTPVSSLRYGTTVSSSKIFAPDSTIVGDPENRLYSSHLNSEFVKYNAGKSFSVWTPIDILTDEDLEEVFKTRVITRDGWSGPTFYTDVEQQVSEEGMKIIDDFYRVINDENASEEEIKEARRIYYERKKGKSPISLLKLGQLQNVSDTEEGDNILAPVKLFATQRKISLAQLYNLSRIIHFIQGYISFGSLTKTQQNLLGGGSDTSRSNAIRYMSSILGDFSYNLIASGDKDSIKENFAKLKDSYRLMTKGSAHNLLNGLWATFEELASGDKATPQTKEAYKRFVNNLILILNSEPKKAKTTDNSNRICLTVEFRHPTSKKFKKFLIKKKEDGRLYIYPQNGYSYANIPIDTNGIEAKGLNSDKIFKEIVDSIVKSKAVEGYHRELTLDNLKSGKILFDLTTEVVNNSTLTASYYVPTDCDYVSRLLRQIDLSSINNLEEVFRKSSYFKHGITLNDSGVRRDPTNSFWATMNQADEGSIERTSDIEVMYPPTFVAAISDDNFKEFDDSTEEAALQSAFTSGEIFAENTLESLSEFQENLLTSISETMEMVLDNGYDSIVISEEILNRISEIENDTTISIDQKKQNIVNLLNEVGQNGGLIDGLEGLSISFDKNGFNISRIEGLTKPKPEEVPQDIQENLSKQGENMPGFFSAVNGNIDTESAKNVAASVYPLYGKPGEVILDQDTIIATWNNIQNPVYLLPVDDKVIALSSDYYQLVELLSSINPELANEFTRLLLEVSSTKEYDRIADFYSDNIMLFEESEEMTEIFTNILESISTNIETLC